MLLDWLIGQRGQGTEGGVSASLLGVRVAYEGKLLDPARVVLHRSLDPIMPLGNGAPGHVDDRAAMPGPGRGADLA